MYASSPFLVPSWLHLGHAYQGMAQQHLLVLWGPSHKLGIALPFRMKEGREGVCRQCEQDLDMASSWAGGYEDARRVVGVGKEGRGCKGALLLILSFLVFASLSDYIPPVYPVSLLQMEHDNDFSLHHYTPTALTLFLLTSTEYCMRGLQALQLKPKPGGHSLRPPHGWREGHLGVGGR